MIAVAGLDMAIWDALAKAADLPLAVLLGGTIGPVPAYNSNGLWLADVATLASEASELVSEGSFTGLKLRLGRDRLDDDLAAIREVREAAGSDIKLMVDFNQGLPLGDAIRRCHALDDQALYWFEEPIAYDNLSGYVQLAAQLNTPVQLGENFYGPRDLYKAVRASHIPTRLPWWGFGGMSNKRLQSLGGHDLLVRRHGADAHSRRSKLC
jgi:mandelate racemase